MRVVCVDLRNPVTGETDAASPWLTLDHEYDVLEVYAYPGSRVELRLKSDDESTPALFDSAMFMAVDSQVPKSWEAKIEDGGVLRLGPVAWMSPGFWEAFFDREPAAVDAYDREVRRAQ